jgi:hypothetical protein
VDHVMQIVSHARDPPQLTVSLALHLHHLQLKVNVRLAQSGVSVCHVVEVEISWANAINAKKGSRLTTKASVFPLFAKSTGSSGTTSYQHVRVVQASAQHAMVHFPITALAAYQGTISHQDSIKNVSVATRHARSA